MEAVSHQSLTYLLRSGYSTTTGFLTLAWRLCNQGVLELDWPVSNLQVAKTIQAVRGPSYGEVSGKWGLSYVSN